MKITIGVIGKNEQHRNDHVDAATMVGRRAHRPPGG